MAQAHGLPARIRYNSEVADARRGDGTWRIRCTDGTEMEADMVVAATGVLHHPRMPDIPGLSDFRGACFHSAQWRHDEPLDGRRIGVIGTGSTATQITAALVPRVGRLSLFQRTAQWVFPLPNPELVTLPIERVEAEGVRTADGHLHALDVLVLATGFEAQRYVRALQLINERGETLVAAWSGGARALRSVAVPGFANFFMVAGPYTPVGNYPLIQTSEIQADYIMAFVERFRNGEASRFEARPEALERFVRDMDAGAERTIWRTGGCRSWYLDERGRISMWPWSFERFRREMRRPQWQEYSVS